MLRTHFVTHPPRPARRFIEWIRGVAGRSLPTALVLGLVGCASETPESKPHEPQLDEAASDPHAGHAGGKSDAELSISAEPAMVIAGTPAELRLALRRRDGSIVDKLETVHEQKVHLIIVRDVLDEFAHIHPKLDGQGRMTARFTFPTGGRYLLFADHKPAGEPQATARAAIQVEGDAPASAALKPNVPGRVAGDELAAAIAIQPADPAAETRITFDLFDSSGRRVDDLEHYLGARGHLVIISADGDQYVHSHPVEGGTAEPNRVAFAAHFPKAGLYKGWGQFQRASRVLTIPFVMVVE